MLALFISQELRGYKRLCLSVPEIHPASVILAQMIFLDLSYLLEDRSKNAAPN